MIFETISRSGLFLVIIKSLFMVFEVRFASPAYVAVTIYFPLALMAYPLKDADPFSIATVWL